MNLPLYKDLALNLTQQIDNGKFAVGSFLPTELEISKEYDVSRATVRAAIAILEQQGLVSRKKKAATKVEATSLHQPYQYDLNSITDLIYLGEQHIRKVLDTDEIVVDLKLAQQYQLPAGERFISMKSVRLEDNLTPQDKIFSITQLYFPITYQDVIPQILNSPAKLVALLIEEFSGKSISHIEQSIQSVVLTREIESIFGIETMTLNARLCIYRKYFCQNNELLLASSSIHRDENFVYKFNLYRK